jgi:asparagine synthetase B (glutamine-hydrolysing)
MSFTAVFSQDRSERETRIHSVKKYYAERVTASELISIDFASCWIGFTQDGELFLNYCNQDAERGPRCCVVIMGYVSYGEPGLEGNRLAERLFQDWTVRGDALFAALEGSFSIFLHDIAKDRSVIVTDCMASRMVWHSEVGSTLVVGDEITAVAAGRGGSFTLDRCYLWSFLNYARTVSDRSFFHEIRSVEPGTVLTILDGVPASRTQYFVPRFQPQVGRRVDDLAEEFVDLLSQTIRDACQSREKPALFLSGGLDSRLLAGLCPSHVTAVTLCDRVNTEVSLAQKIAARAGLRHKVIYRNSNWYPSLIQEAAENYAATWGWAEAHYLPLGRPEQQFEFDTVMLGFGCDTYFKGLHLKWPRLWDDGGQPPSPEAFFQKVMEAPYRATSFQPILNPDFSTECKREFAELAGTDIARISQWASTTPDLWELFWSRNMAGVPEVLNLVCLREFTSERNIFSSPRLRKLSLTIPPEVRASGDIVRAALRIVGKGLATLPDSSSMLPPALPYGFHKAALKLRSHLGAIRRRILTAKGSSEISGQCAWSRLDRLLVVDDATRSLLLQLIDDDRALPSSLFDKGKIKSLAERHLQGHADHYIQLMLLMTFGINHSKLFGLLEKHI